MADINGMAHVQLTVSDMRRSVPFYRRLLQTMGMTLVVDTPDFYYHVGGRTALALCPADPALKDIPHRQWAPGLHHLCFRARSREDVDEIHAVALELGALIVHAPREDGHAPGYYSVLFEDPDGFRIEANYVPGKGHLEPGVQLPFRTRAI